MANVLLITDPNGMWFISPLGNRADFEGFNGTKLNGTSEYKIVEMEKTIAEAKVAASPKNPEFVPLAMQADEIVALRNQLKELEQQKLELQRMLSESPSMTPNAMTVIGAQPDVHIPETEANPGFTTDPAEPGSTLNQLGAGEKTTMNNGILDTVAEAAANPANDPAVVRARRNQNSNQ